MSRKGRLGLILNTDESMEIDSLCSDWQLPSPALEDNHESPRRSWTVKKFECALQPTVEDAEDEDLVRSDSSRTASTSSGCLSPQSVSDTEPIQVNVLLESRMAVAPSPKLPRRTADRQTRNSFKASRPSFQGKDQPRPFILNYRHPTDTLTPTVGRRPFQADLSGELLRRSKADRVIQNIACETDRLQARKQEQLRRLRWAKSVLLSHPLEVAQTYHRVQGAELEMLGML